MNNSSRGLLKAYKIDLKTNIVNVLPEKLLPGQQVYFYLMLNTRAAINIFNKNTEGQFHPIADTQCYSRELHDYVESYTPIQLIN